MSKIKLTEFGSPPISVTQTTINNITFDVYPIIDQEQAFAAVQEALNLAITDRLFIDYAALYPVLKVIKTKYWTNIDIDADDTIATYDLLNRHGIIAAIEPLINIEQQTYFETATTHCLESIVEYRNSAAGIVEILSNKQQNMSTEINELLEKLNSDQLENLMKFAELASPPQ